MTGEVENYINQKMVRSVKENCKNLYGKHDSQTLKFLYYFHLTRKLFKNNMRVVCRFEYQSLVNHVDVWNDSDHAGCLETRKSTSGGIVMMGEQCIKAWSVTQSVISLSSGEAEYYSMVKGASVA